jgi:hypothetical protein
VYCKAVLIGIVPGFGVTVIVASGPAVTMTVAEADTPLHVTTTVLVNVPAAVPAVNRPAWVIVPPPAATDQTGVLVVMTLPSLSVITTVNCWVPPVGIVAVVGAITTVAMVRGPLESSHAAVNSPANATATMTRAMRARFPSARTVTLFVTLFIELLLTGCM